MKVVEFVGAPGSGKSRVAWTLIDELPGHEILDLRHAVHRSLKSGGTRRGGRLLLNILPVHPGIRVAGQMAAHGSAGRAAMKRFEQYQDGYLDGVRAAMAARIATFPEPARYLEWVTSLCARYSIARDGLADDVIVFIEEGFATRGVGLFGFSSASTDETDIRDYAAAMPAPAVLIHVDTDFETCKRRLEERGWTRRSRTLSPEDRLAFLGRSIQASRIISDELGRRGVDVVSVPNDDPGRELLVASLAGAVKTLGGGARN